MIPGEERIVFNSLWRDVVGAWNTAHQLREIHFDIGGDLEKAMWFLNNFDELVAVLINKLDSVYEAVKLLHEHGEVLVAASRLSKLYERQSAVLDGLEGVLQKLSDLPRDDAEVVVGLYNGLTGDVADVNNLQYVVSTVNETLSVVRDIDERLTGAEKCVAVANRCKKRKKEVVDDMRADVNDSKLIRDYVACGYVVGNELMAKYPNVTKQTLIYRLKRAGVYMDSSAKHRGGREI